MDIMNQKGQIAMTALMYETETRASTQALMLAFAEEYVEQQDDSTEPASPFDRDGECWGDFWATYAENME